MRRTDVHGVPLSKATMLLTYVCRVEIWRIKNGCTDINSWYLLRKLVTIFLYVRMRSSLLRILRLLLKWAQSKQLTVLSFNEIYVCIEWIILGGHRSIAIRGRGQTRTSLQLRAKCWQRLTLESRSPQSTVCIIRALLSLCSMLFQPHYIIHRSSHQMRNAKKKREKRERKIAGKRKYEMK